MFDRLRAWVGSGPHRRHRRPVPAGGTRLVRLPPWLFLARAGAGPVEPRPRLDQEVRGSPERLAPHRHHFPVMATNSPTYVARHVGRRFSGAVVFVLTLVILLSSEHRGFSPGVSAQVQVTRPNPSRGPGTAGNGMIYVGNYKGT